MLSGDEVRRTQRGNNNAYCQSNELSGFGWDRDTYAVRDRSIVALMSK
jgi:pullulanase/glycogen debranching enzyme